MQRADVDVAVIGGGAAGLVAAAGCAALGGHTVLIERDRLGGECTWTGCVPSKALLHIARHAALARAMPELGIAVNEPLVDFQAVMRSVRATRRKIYEHGESPAYLKELGIRPLKAEARFLDERAIRIERGGRAMELGFRSAIIATGSRPAVPPIDGLGDVPYLTTDTLFEIDELPGRLAILGGGSTGVEMAQAFARLGSKVTLISDAAQLLPGTDHWAAQMLASALEDDGVTLRLQQTISWVMAAHDGIKMMISGLGSRQHATVDALLLATGRTTNTSGLNLEALGVDFNRSGIIVDDRCRTSLKHIFAVGDVTGAPGYTHLADNMARVAALNAMTRLPLQRYERRVVPRIVYTDPEIACVGRTEPELAASGTDHDVIDLPFDRVDRAAIEGRAVGCIRVYHRRGRILGVTAAGTQAGEMIDLFALAMKNGVSLSGISQTVLGYPTMLLGAKRVADQFLLRLPRRWMLEGFRRAYGYHGEIPAYIGGDRII